MGVCVVNVAGSDVTPSRSELLEDVRHLVRGSGHARASVCLPELVGTHDPLSWHHRHGTRRQQGSCGTAENCTRSGRLLATLPVSDFTAVLVQSTAPSYIAKILHSTADIGSRQHLQSAYTSTLVIPFT